MRTEYTYDHYYLYDEIRTILEGYAEKYPQYCRLSAIGETPKKRSILLLEVTDLSTGDFAEKPAFVLDGNVHAGEVTGSMACMYFLDTIFSNMEEKEIRTMLENYTIYCVPRISPDGSEHYLTTPDMLRSADRMYPYDELQAGIQPQDIDGDGVIRQMRVKNPHGVFKIYEKDPRIMVKREADEVIGDFYDVFREGVIVKHDPMKENMPADDKYGNDFNRNLAAGWGIGGRGGAYAFSNPETYAFANFLFAHKNICACLNFHTYAGIYLYPPAMKGRNEVPSADVRRYQEIGNLITAETGYPFVNLHDEFLRGRSVGGSLDDFAHQVLGFLGFTCECWDIDARCGREPKFPSKPMSDEEMIAFYEKRFAWMKDNEIEYLFKDWTKIDHPELGEVEVGGFDVKHLMQNPPEKFLLEEVEKHTRFMLRMVRLLPRLKVEVKKTKVQDAYKVDVIVSNTAYLPTYVTDVAKGMKQLQPITVQVSGCELIEGKESTDIGQLNGYALTGTDGWGTGGTTLNHEPSRKVLHYLVKGDSVTVEAGSQRSGRKTVTVQLKED